jgi:soluble lytic murein transglycosylase-like protein
MFVDVLYGLQKSVFDALAQRLASLPGSGTHQSGALHAGDPGQFKQLIESAARRYGVDPALVTAVVQAESNFSPTAVSFAGAKGLMQLMDVTARTLGVANAFDPLQNVDGGVRFLRSLLDRYGDVGLALAAYNAGPAAVDRYGGIPPYKETQVYVSRVLDLRDQYRQWIA